MSFLVFGYWSNDILCYFDWIVWLVMKKMIKIKIVLMNYYVNGLSLFLLDWCDDLNTPSPYWEKTTLYVERFTYWYVVKCLSNLYISVVLEKNRKKLWQRKKIQLLSIYNLVVIKQNILKLYSICQALKNNTINVFQMCK